MSPTPPLTELSFTVSARVSRPCAETYEAVVDPERLSCYFTTGGARGRLEPGADVTWDFLDFPGRFPVTVVEAEAPRHLAIEWDGEHTADGAGRTRATFTFEPLDGDTRTLVTITESAWAPTLEGAASAFGNCEGWTGMLLALKCWLEYGVNLRAGLYA